MSTQTESAPPGAMEAMKLEWIEPGSLLADANVRKDPRLTKPFLASIAEHGVLVPLVCVRTEHGIRIRYGHRRAFAAIEAGLRTVPCIVADPADTSFGDEVDRILTQYDENTHREGLTTTENAGVVADLLDLGLTTEFIAKQTQMHRDDVHAAQKVARSKVATAAADKHDFLSLDQAAALADFEDDASALSELDQAAKISDGHFAHQLQRLRDDREQAEVLAADRAEAEAAGLTVLDQRPPWENRVAELTDAAGKHIRASIHRKCPGHAVYIVLEYQRGDGAPHWKASQAAYCTNPKANGHKTPRGASSASKQTTEERREVIDNNKLWRSAETVRRAWIREYLTRKNIPAGALRFVLEALARGEAQLTGPMSGYGGSHALARELLGIPDGETKNYQRASEVLEAMLAASPGRAQVIALGIVLGAYESATDVQTWRPSIAGWAQRYFAFLKELGYGLSDLEQTVAGHE